MKHVPATKSKVEPIRDNYQNSLSSCSIVQHCLLVACPIELDCPWNEQSEDMSGYYSKKYDRSLQSVSLENQPQPILLRWPSLYFNDAVLKACLALPKLCTMRSVSLHEGTRCYTPQHLHVCAKVVILPLLDVSAKCFASVCTTHVFVAATCPECPCNIWPEPSVMSGHLKTAGKHCHQQAQLLNKILNTWWLVPRGTVNFVSLESQCFPQLRLGKHWDSRETKFTVLQGTSR